MEICKAVLLGIVQGLTEFLPVSSSGHLVIVSELLHFQDQGVVFDVCVHLGTLLAVLVVFRREILAMALAPLHWLRGRRDGEVRLSLCWDGYVILATLPAVCVGLLWKDEVEALFTSVLVTYLMLIVTGALMIGARYLPDGVQPIRWHRALLVGCAQACAILPGLSRSGSTIFAGMALGVPRETIARFSFIMSVPAILGAAVLQVPDLLDAPPGRAMTINLLLGTLFSMISGYLAIKLLLDVIRRNRLQWFGYYCMVVAALGLTHYYVG